MKVLLVLLLPLLVNSGPISLQIQPQDCSDIYRNDIKTSGVYTIYPKKDMPVDVFCDMGCSDDQSGGWTVFQKRLDGTLNFYRPWDSYRNGFGNKSGEYWLGLESLNLLTQRRNNELKVELEDFEGIKVYAQYPSFSVDTEANGYTLHVSGFINGGGGDALSYHNGMKFSTFDRDQDMSGSNCAKVYLGAFWYNACHFANPNGVYITGRDGSLFAIGNVWYHWKGYDYGLKKIIMKTRPVP